MKEFSISPAEAKIEEGSNQYMKVMSDLRESGVDLSPDAPVQSRIDALTPADLASVKVMEGRFELKQEQQALAAAEAEQAQQMLEGLRALYTQSQDSVE